LFNFYYTSGKSSDSGYSSSEDSNSVGLFFVSDLSFSYKLFVELDSQFNTSYALLIDSEPVSDELSVQLKYIFYLILFYRYPAFYISFKNI